VPCSSGIKVRLCGGTSWRSLAWRLSNTGEIAFAPTLSQPAKPLSYTMTARSHGYRYFFQYEARTVDWKSATKISFFVGCIFLFATAGNPWGFSAVIVPTVMGREIFPATASHLSFGYMIFHVALGILFGLTMAPVLQRLKIVAAIAVSIPFGLLFYAFNYTLFHTLLSTHGNSGEIGVLFTNIAFAILFAAAYRVLARGRESMRTVENARQK
jgi:hypothetical protein